MAYQAMARCNKCGSGLAPRCAARAALDFKGAEDPEASASRCAARAALDRKSATALATGTSTSNSNLCELPDPGIAPNW